MSQGGGLWSSFHSAPSLEERQTEFRKLLSALAEQLQPDDIRKCSFLKSLPNGRTSTALETLDYLMKKGTFSHSNVDPLIRLLQDINRCDLVTDLVDQYRNDYPAPPTTTMDVLPTMTELNTGLSALRNEPLSISSKQSIHNPEMPAMQETAATLPTPVGDESATVIPSQQGKVFTAVKRRDKTTTSSYQAAASTSSSMDELERYTSVLPQQDKTSPSQPDDPTLTQHHNHNLSQSHTPQNLNKQFSSQVNTTSTPVSLGSRSMSATTHTQRRSMTPPALLNKRISEPLALGRGGYAYTSLPLNTTPPFRPVSSGLASHDSQQSPSGLLGDDEHRDDEIQSEVFQQSSQPEDTGTEASPQHAEATSDGSGADVHNGMLFRKRANSTKKRLLKKISGFRNRSPSIVTWSVKRDKLNELIYKHLKDKRLKCPHGLELENGGKHAPRLTLYLHPYGYEEDAGKSLTLLVSLEASVKSNLPSSAVIRVEISANESTQRKILNKTTIDCHGDFRIARQMSFLSHQLLKDIECETIEFQASAKLFS